MSLSEQIIEKLIYQIKIEMKDLCALSHKEITSLSKYEELAEKVNSLLICLDDLITAWKIRPDSY